MKFIAAKCPACNGELQVPDDRDFVKCMYCGVDVKIREATKMKIDVNIPNLFNLAKESLKSHNYQESYNYYSKILEAEINNWEAWFGKGESAGGLLLNLSNTENKEILVCFENAIKYYSGDNIEDFKILISSKIYDYCNEYFKKVLNYKNNIATIHNKWDEYIAHCKNMIAIAEKGLEYDSTNLKLLNGIIAICQDNIAGYLPQLKLNDWYKKQLTNKINTCNEKIRMLRFEGANKGKWQKWEEETKNIKEYNKKITKKTMLKSIIIFFIVGIILSIILQVYVLYQTEYNIETTSVIKNIFSILFLSIIVGIAIGLFIGQSGKKALPKSPEQ